MFETDDFDEVLSQFEVPIPLTITDQPRAKKLKPLDIARANLEDPRVTSAKENRDKLQRVFNSNAKREFPGPAGILKGALGNKNIEDLENIEVISQDIEALSSNDKFDTCSSKLWHVCLSELTNYGLEEPTSIEKVKNHARLKMLRKQKAGVIVALIESIERSASDPLIRLRDESDVIKCTLHRDAWATLSNFIIADGTIIVLKQPTVFTIGSTHKKYYLNITLANIVALFSLHQVATQEVLVLPDHFEKLEKDSFIIIKRTERLSCGGDCDKEDTAKHIETQSEYSKLQKDTEEDLLDVLTEESFLNEDF